MIALAGFNGRPSTPIDQVKELGKDIIKLQIRRGQEIEYGENAILNFILSSIYVNLMYLLYATRQLDRSHPI